MLSDQQYSFIDQFVMKLPVREAAQDAENAGAHDLDAVLRDWQASLEAVDTRISRLCQFLIATGDAELKQIAEFGLNAVTGNHKVRLQAALIDLRGGDLPKAVAKALPLVQGFRNHVAKSDTVAACDENPFGIKVEMRATLGPALDRLASALQRVAA